MSIVSVMRRFLCILAIVGLCAFTHGSGGGGGGGGSTNWTATGNPAWQAFNTTVTFTAVPIGTAAGNRYVIVCVVTHTGSADGAPTALTVGGVSATLATTDGGTNGYASLWYANVTTGTTANVVVTPTGCCGDPLGITVGMINTAHPTPASTAGLPASGYNSPFIVGPETIASGGVAVACGVDNESPATLAAYTGNTLDFVTDDTALGQTDQMYLGHATTSGNSVGFTSSSGTLDFAALAVAVWGP